MKNKLILLFVLGIVVFGIMGVRNFVSAKETCCNSNVCGCDQCATEGACEGASNCGWDSDTGTCQDTRPIVVPFGPKTPVVIGGVPYAITKVIGREGAGGFFMKNEKGQQYKCTQQTGGRSGKASGLFARRG